MCGKHLKMKVLLVSRRLYPDVKGGGEISAFYTAQALLKSGIEVLFCTFTTENKKSTIETFEGVKICKLPIKTISWMPRFSNLEYMYKQMENALFPVINSYKPDILHAFNIEAIPSIAWLSRKTKIPFFATINSPGLCCFPGNGERHVKKYNKKYDEKTYFKTSVFICLKCSFDAWGGTLFKNIKAFVYWIYGIFHLKLLQRTAGNAKKLFPISNAMAEMLYSCGYSAKKIKVIPIPTASNIIELQINKSNKINEIDKINEINKINKNSLKKKLKLQEKKVLLYTGRLSKTKGIQNTIEAMQYIDNASFIVIGKGPDKEEFEQLAEKLNVQDKIIFLPFIDTKSLYKYFSIADIVVHPCTYFEPFSRMLLDACTYGVPIVASRIGGIPDVVIDGKTGILLDDVSGKNVAIAINKLFDNPKLRHQMSKNAKKHAKIFSQEIIGNLLKREYESELAVKR